MTRSTKLDFHRGFTVQLTYKLIKVGTEHDGHGMIQHVVHVMIEPERYILTQNAMRRNPIVAVIAVLCPCPDLKVQIA